MSKEQREKLPPLLRFASFFELALDKIDPSWMKALVALFVVLLLALVITRGSTSPNLGFILIALLVFVFGFLLWLLEYVKIRLDYETKTAELLKGELREAVHRLLELEGAGYDYPQCGNHGTSEVTDQGGKLVRSGRIRRAPIK
jgi:hypothetical protein